MAINVYQMVTDRILAQLQQGVIPWRKPWSGGEPINYISRKPYRGVNLMLLPQGGEWLTFNQCQSAGGRIKKGAKSNMIVFFTMMEYETSAGDTDTFPFLKYSNVFHLSQTEGITSKIEAPAARGIEPIQAAQNIMDAYLRRSQVNMNSVNGSNKAFYQPSTDTITLPTIGQFDSAEGYYSTAFHEAAHSTGHESRLNRINKVAMFGSGDYSREELVAEITAANILNYTGIEIQQTFANSAAYIAGWSRRIKDDIKAIVTASGAAQKATDWILGI